MKSKARTVLLLLGDTLALVLAFWGMLFVAFYNNLTNRVVTLHSFPFFILSIIWIIIFFLFNLYDTEATRVTIPHLRKIFTAFVVALAVSVTFFYTIGFFKITPKTNLAIFGGLALVFFVSWRRIFYNIFASHFRKDVVFIVSEKRNLSQVNDLRDYIATYPQSGFKVVGVYDSIPKFKTGSSRNSPQVFIVSKEIWRDPENFRSLQDMNAEILDLAEAYEDILGRVPIEAIDEGWFMQRVNSKQHKIRTTAERVVGIVLAALILVILSPVLLLIGILIKLQDGGPIIYSQIRVGRGGKNFELYKFRSMIPNAEKNGPEWSSKKDNRVTPIGKIIRILHTDEVPQMWNVIKGDIALVGPRPERPEFVKELEGKIPFYYLRHSISPGFTGWAQIKFRYAGNVMDSQEKFKYDLYYLKNKNIFMDLGILLRTVQIIFTHWE